MNHMANYMRTRTPPAPACRVIGSVGLDPSGLQLADDIDPDSWLVLQEPGEKLARDGRVSRRHPRRDLHLQGADDGGNGQVQLGKGQVRRRALARPLAEGHQPALGLGGPLVRVSGLAVVAPGLELEGPRVDFLVGVDEVRRLREGGAAGDAVREPAVPRLVLQVLVGRVKDFSLSGSASFWSMECSTVQWLASSVVGMLPLALSASASFMAVRVRSLARSRNSVAPRKLVLQLVIQSGRNSILLAMKGKARANGFILMPMWIRSLHLRPRSGRSSAPRLRPKQYMEITSGR